MTSLCGVPRGIPCKTHRHRCTQCQCPSVRPAPGGLLHGEDRIHGYLARHSPGTPPHGAAVVDGKLPPEGGAGPSSAYRYTPIQARRESLPHRIRHKYRPTRNYGMAAGPNSSPDGRNLAKIFIPGLPAPPSPNSFTGRAHRRLILDSGPGALRGQVFLQIRIGLHHSTSGGAGACTPLHGGIRCGSPSIHLGPRPFKVSWLNRRSTARISAWARTSLFQPGICVAGRTGSPIHQGPSSTRRQPTSGRSPGSPGQRHRRERTNPSIPGVGLPPARADGNFRLGVPPSFHSSPSSRDGRFHRGRLHTSPRSHYRHPWPDTRQGEAHGVAGTLPHGIAREPRPSPPHSRGGPPQFHGGGYTTPLERAGGRDSPPAASILRTPSRQGAIRSACTESAVHSFAALLPDASSSPGETAPSRKVGARIHASATQPGMGPPWRPSVHPPPHLFVRGGPNPAIGGGHTTPCNGSGEGWYSPTPGAPKVGAVHAASTCYQSGSRPGSGTAPYPGRRTSGLGGPLRRSHYSSGSGERMEPRLSGPALASHSFILNDSTHGLLHGWGTARFIYPGSPPLHYTDCLRPQASSPGKPPPRPIERSTLFHYEKGLPLHHFGRSGTGVRRPVPDFRYCHHPLHSWRAGRPIGLFHSSTEMPPGVAYRRPALVAPAILHGPDKRVRPLPAYKFFPTAPPIRAQRHFTPYGMSHPAAFHLFGKRRPSRDG